jgi:hypothetical protein
VQQDLELFNSVNSVMSYYRPAISHRIEKILGFIRKNIPFWNGKDKKDASPRMQILDLLSKPEISLAEYLHAMELVERLALEVEGFLKDEIKASSEVINEVFFFVDLSNLKLLLDRYATLPQDGQLISKQALIKNISEVIVVFMHLYNLAVKNSLAPKSNGTEQNYFLTDFASAMNHWRATEGHVMGLLPSEFWEELFHYSLKHTPVNDVNVKHLMLADLPIMAKQILFNQASIQDAKYDFLERFPNYRIIFKALFFDVPRDYSACYKDWSVNLSAIYKVSKSSDEHAMAWYQALNYLDHFLGSVEMTRLVFQFSEPMRKSYFKNCSETILLKLIVTRAQDYRAHRQLLIVPQKPQEKIRRLYVSNSSNDKSYRLVSDQPVMVLYQYEELFKKVLTEVLTEERKRQVLTQISGSRNELAIAWENQFDGEYAFFCRRCEVFDLGRFSYRLHPDVNTWSGEDKKWFATYKNLTANLLTEDQHQTGLEGEALKPHYKE